MERRKFRNVSCQTDIVSSKVSKKLHPQKRSGSNDNSLSMSNKHLKINETLSNDNSIYKLSYNFFSKNCIDLAKNLLGKILVRRLPSGEILKGRIVETECYLGFEDKASHSYKGKRTNRNIAMYAPPGTAYVYSIHGIYFCFNISSYGEGAAVLIRALEPLQGMSTMELFRLQNRRTDLVLKPKDLCSGPSKLCHAFKINKQEHNKIDLCNSEDLWLEDGIDVNSIDIIACQRIGIASAGAEWANKPLRFYIRNCGFVSVRNKNAEKEHSELNLL